MKRFFKELGWENGVLIFFVVVAWAILVTGLLSSCGAPHQQIPRWQDLGRMAGLAAIDEVARTDGIPSEKALRLAKVCHALDYGAAILAGTGEVTWAERAQIQARLQELTGFGEVDTILAADTLSNIFSLVRNANVEPEGRIYAAVFLSDLATTVLERLEARRLMQ